VEIILSDAGKKFYREWIFRHVNLTFSSNQKIVITGPNGSGKSTLLQVLAGATTLTEGKLNYKTNGNNVDDDSVFNHISFASPYLELIEEFTLLEIIKFQIKLKRPITGLTVQSILEKTGLEPKANGIFKFFSSGMKQRVRLSLAMMSDTPVLILDEPCSNLDAEGVEWYRQMINHFASDRLVIVASNEHKEEYFFCDTHLHITDFKQ
jgi:ABC-type multidrug transport system ATPase subunit